MPKPRVTRKPTATVNASEGRETFADILNRVCYQGEHVLVTRYGKPVAHVISPALFDRLSREAA